MNQQGATLVETMTALIIFGMMVIAIYPAFTEIQKISKTTNVKRLCQQVVSSKLESYKAGIPIDLINSYISQYASHPRPANQTQLTALSVESYSDESMGTAGEKRVLSGFSYAKIRYNHFFPESCIGTSTAGLVSGFSAYQTLGIRECVGSHTAWIDGSPPSGGTNPCASNTADQKVNRELPNFKLYVKLELETPWKYNTATTVTPGGGSNPSLGQRLHDHCPNVGNSAAGTASYDFSGQSDGIKVTVTGFPDIKEAGIAQLAGASTPFDLVCQASAVLTPYRYPARYILTQQGKIYTVHGTGWNKVNEQQTNSTGVMVFKNIYESPALAIAGPAAANPYSSTSISSISVHPRDAAVWVLRPGLLTRYSNCHGTPTNCEVGTTDTVNGTGGFPDVAAWKTAGTPLDGNWPQVQRWNIPSGISSIGVDYRSGRIYGFAKSQSGGTLQELFLNGPVSAPTGSLGRCGVVDCASAFGFQDTSLTGATGQNITGFRKEVYSQSIEGSAFPRPYFTSLPARINTFFMSPSGDAAFITDNTSSMTLGEEVYSTSVYRITDPVLGTPIMTFPFYVTGFSM